MKRYLLKYLWLILILIFAGMIEFTNSISEKSSLNYSEDSGYYTKGVSQKEYRNVTPVSDYDFNVIFKEAEDKIHVEEKIVWRNLTGTPANEIHFHLYANTYANDSTLFAGVYKLPPEAKTKLQIKSATVNGNKKELLYFQPDVKNPSDSTVAKIIMDNAIAPEDSAIIEFIYELKIPVSVKRFGKAAGADFYFISQWFPKVGVYENGKWVCNQYFPRLNYYSDFGNYRAIINLPAHYTFASTGVIIKQHTANSRSTYEVVQNGVHDFAWVFAGDVLDTSRVYLRKDGSRVNLRMIVQKGREEYIERYFNSSLFSLRFMEENIGQYPYSQITLVDCPRTSASGGMEYPTLFTVSADLFQPEVTHYPEKLVMHEFIHQYFYGVLSNNETAEAWLDEGFTSYFASLMAKKYFKEKGNLTFKAFGYLPVYGINYFDIYEVPIIYSLGEFKYPEEGRAVKRYYSEKLIGAIADTSYKLPTVNSYIINAYSKPELMLTSLERILGEKKFLQLINIYYSKFKFKHPKTDDFINLTLSKYPDLKWFFDETFYSSKLFDDRIRYIKRTGKGEYTIFLERLGDGKFRSDVWVYTERDTIKFIWDDISRYKVLKIKTDSKIIAAEIDPLRKNLFDVNYSNNSYVIEKKYWGTASISIKWFFWIQNALMILGSIV